MFHPCIIIPVYKHGELLKKSIGKIGAFGYPIILVDDGNLPETRKILEDIESKSEKITLLRLPQNQGKGGAVIAGFKHAGMYGYSHALQIDADGQHNVSDIALFIEKAKQHPKCPIIGTPVYDSTVPKSRLYGRKITTFWVALETLSYDIKDAMCGFRVYPLKPVLELLQRRTLSRHMEFDIEILVRLHWRGLKIVNQPTRITYPEAGISNFRVLTDNAKLSYVHAKLFFEMLYRKLFFFIHIRKGYDG